MGYLKSEFEKLMSELPAALNWGQNQKDFAHKFFMTGAACLFYKSVNVCDECADNEEAGRAMFDDFHADLEVFKQECLMKVMESRDPEKIKGLVEELLKNREEAE